MTDDYDARYTGDLLAKLDTLTPTQQQELMTELVEKVEKEREDGDE